LEVEGGRLEAFDLILEAADEVFLALAIGLLCCSVLLFAAELGSRAGRRGARGGALVTGVPPVF
jgi:hypothetical protein